ncbi:regulatory protein RecX [Cryobacterium sp. MLB-32]|uniref:regulatory protein RecX n=1 Tax=Cryobacterium sp. MLB-32 TaxID=1529318 RepID=UPI00068D8822|nr:regulatory protein RecX [Cryobacterium sp. MLB-32]
MVHFVPADEADAPTIAGQNAAVQNADGPPARVAPVAYLPGAAPGMTRRTPVVQPETGTKPRKKTVFERDDSVTDDASNDDMPDDDAPEDGVNVSVDVEAAERGERAEAALLQRLRARSLSLVEAFAVLKDLDLDDGEAHDMIERFTQLAYLDDEKLADQIIHTHHVRKGLGRAGVETEMRRRKLDAGIMLDKLEELPDDELERAIEEGTKRIAQLSRFDDQTIDRRLNAFLMRKGYNSQIVRVAVKASLDSRNGSSTVRFR